MKVYLILLPIFILALFQATFLPLNLVLLTILLWLAFRSGKGNLAVVFFAGLFLDLAEGHSLGLSSLLFIINLFLFTLYSRRFDSRHPLFLAIFVFLANSVYLRLINNAFDWSAALILGFLALVVSLLWRGFKGNGERQIIKLREPR